MSIITSIILLLSLATTSDFTIVNSAMVNESITLTPTFDSDLYRWDFGDNTSLNSRCAVTHLYTTPGLYTVLLTSNGQVISKSIIITESNKNYQFVLPPKILLPEMNQM